MSGDSRNHDYCHAHRSHDPTKLGPGPVAPTMTIRPSYKFRSRGTGGMRHGRHGDMRPWGHIAPPGTAQPSPPGSSSDATEEESKHKVGMRVEEGSRSAQGACRMGRHAWWNEHVWYWERGSSKLNPSGPNVSWPPNIGPASPNVCMLAPQPPKQS